MVDSASTDDKLVEVGASACGNVKDDAITVTEGSEGSEDNCSEVVPSTTTTTTTTTLICDDDKSSGVVVVVDPVTIELINNEPGKAKDSNNLVENKEKSTEEAVSSETTSTSATTTTSAPKAVANARKSISTIANKLKHIMEEKTTVETTTTVSTISVIPVTLPGLSLSNESDPSTGIIAPCLLVFVYFHLLFWI